VPLCPHDDVVYREPTPLERAFLALVTRAHPGFARQVEHVVVGDYDPTGWCFTRIENADVAPVRDHADGPTLRRNRPNEKPIYIETIGASKAARTRSFSKLNDSEKSSNRVLPHDAKLATRRAKTW